MTWLKEKLQESASHPCCRLTWCPAELQMGFLSSYPTAHCPQPHHFSGSVPGRVSSTYAGIHPIIIPLDVQSVMLNTREPWLLCPYIILVSIDFASFLQGPSSNHRIPRPSSHYIHLPWRSHTLARLYFALYMLVNPNLCPVQISFLWMRLVYPVLTGTVHLDCSK